MMPPCAWPMMVRQCRCMRMMTSSTVLRRAACAVSEQRPTHARAARVIGDVDLVSPAHGRHAVIFDDARHAHDPERAVLLHEREEELVARPQQVARDQHRQHEHAAQEQHRQAQRKEHKVAQQQAEQPQRKEIKVPVSSCVCSRPFPLTRAMAAAHANTNTQTHTHAPVPRLVGRRLEADGKAVLIDGGRGLRRERANVAKLESVYARAHPTAVLAPATQSALARYARRHGDRAHFLRCARVRRLENVVQHLALDLVLGGGDLLERLRRIERPRIFAANQVKRTLFRRQFARQRRAASARLARHSFHSVLLMTSADDLHALQALLLRDSYREWEYVVPARLFWSLLT